MSRVLKKIHFISLTILAIGFFILTTEFVFCILNGHLSSTPAGMKRDVLDFFFQIGPIGCALYSIFLICLFLYKKEAISTNLEKVVIFAPWLYWIVHILLLIFYME